MQSVGNDQNNPNKSAHGLGRGLDSLIPVGNDSFAPQPKAENSVAVGLIDPNPMQPRTSFDEAPLAELASSIREYGVIQPLLVSKTGDRYQLVAGERRLRAAKLAGIAEVPVIVRTLDEQNKLELAIIENVQRENLSPIEAALSYKRLMEEFELTQEDVSAKVGKARSTVANALRLLTLPNEIKQGLIDGKITEGHARSIIAIEDRDAQIAFYHRIINEGFNVRQAEQHVKTTRVGAKPQKDPNVRAAEKKLAEAVGTKVKIVSKGDSGKIVIEYYNSEDLDRIYKKIVG